MASTTASAHDDPTRYASQYCEENVRRLVDAQAGEPGRRFAVVITNKLQQVAIWRQRKGDASEDGLVVWDYHVILLSQCDTHGWRVWDYDSVAPFPCAADRYLEDAFKPAEPIAHRNRPVFRVVPADHFIDHFASDRRHMRKRKLPSAGSGEGAATTLAAPHPPSTATTTADAASAAAALEPAPPDVEWLAPPPSWPCYRGRLAASDHNLPMCVAPLSCLLPVPAMPPTSLPLARVGCHAASARACPCACACRWLDTTNTGAAFGGRMLTLATLLSVVKGTVTAEDATGTGTAGAVAAVSGGASA